MPVQRLLLVLLIAAVLPLSAADCPLTFFDAVRYGTVDGSRFIVAGDFDGDGASDIATLPFTGRRIEVLLSRAPGFVHGPATTLAADAVALLDGGDYDRDGRRDVITVGPAAITLGAANADGSFRLTTTAVAGAALTTNAVARDLNGDGRLDVAAVAGSSTQSMRVFLGNSNGTFSERLPAVALNMSRAVDLAAGDVNGDGNGDLLVLGGNFTYLLEGNGDGTFDPQRQIMSAFSSRVRLNVGDFDGDGRDDLTAGTSLLLGSRLGQAAVPLPARAVPLAAVDLDRDGKLDLFTPRELLRGGGDGTFTNLPYTGADGTNAAFADFDGDGNLDAAIADGDVVVQHGLAPFRFTGVTRRSAERSAIGDVNGDGRADLVAVSPFDAEVWLAAADGTLAFGSRLSAGTSVPVLGDFNGDRNLDLFIAGDQVAFGKGDGTFGDAQRGADAISLIAAIAADFNGDGKLDVASAFASSTIGVAIHINDGTGHFTTTTTAPYTSGLGPTALAAADFNGDGASDIAVGIHTPSGPGELHLLNGKSPQTPVRIATGISEHSVAAADMNGDSRADIVTISYPGDELLIFPGNGSGTFGSPLRIDIPDAFYEQLLVADFTGDGRPDIAVSPEESHEALFFVQQSDGAFVETAHPVGSWRYAHAADIDGDGRLDLITGRGVNGGIGVHLNRCPEQLRLTPPSVELEGRGSSGEGLPAAFTAIVGNGATGTVVFYEWTNFRAVALGSATVINGRATLTTSALSRGGHGIYAVYLGDGAFVRARSATMRHEVQVTGPRRRSLRH